MKKARLCLVIPALQVGGMERVMSELAEYFCQREGLEVHLVMYGRSTEVFYPIPDSLRIHKPRKVFNNRFRMFYTIGRLIFLRQTVKKINPDSILSFGEFWNSFVLLALIGLTYQVYISDRCSPAKQFGTSHRLLRKWLYPRTKGVIAQTNKAKQLYSAQFKHNNICVIGNPIRMIQPDNALKRENIVLTVGRLIESKHHDRLIETFAKISQPEWKLIIVGDDALKQKNMAKLKQLIHNLDMDDRIILVGSQANVDYYYLKSKIFAFTSSSEGFPNVIGEAMSAGLPVVSFDCIAGPSEMVIDNKNGFLITLFDFENFANKLHLLMQNDALRQQFGNAAKETIKEYNAEAIGNKFYSFLINSD